MSSSDSFEGQRGYKGGDWIETCARLAQWVTERFK